ncbi:spore germination protein [Bacillus sp. V3-13]|uniref:spore germination protein n=1 Tax=Bacillus sp. V3-13 TaxID=2053728 RepID=UPI000C7862F3|nr:spore germination protein [Bacillus sp. V3-13]PLR76372.1 spore germination protein [Bacillus sp. V3-13]
MTANTDNNMPIPESVDDVEQYLKNRIGLETSFDLGVRKLKILRKDVHLYYINGLSETKVVVQVVGRLIGINDVEKLSTNLFKIIENRIDHHQVKVIENLDELVDQVLSGLMVAVVQGESSGIAIDVRNYPGRQPEEPDVEKVIRGSRDGFVENIVVNTALTRRRVRDERLRFEMIKAGERSKTDIAVVYISDVANQDLVDVIKKEIKGIEIDGLPMADKTVEEYLLKQGYNPYPLVRYTERPDVAAVHLLEGHVLVYVDTSPSVIITPTTYFHHLQHAEEYRQSPTVGTFVRWVRFLGLLASLFLLPLWYLFVQDPSLLPDQLSFIGPNEKTSVPIIVQLFIADIGIEFLRIASIHTPTPLSTSMGLIAAVLIGQIAIDVGLFVPEVILYIAVAAIGTYSTPSYELSIANKIARLLLLLAVAIFNVPGLVVGITLYILLLAAIRSLNTPYLWPFLPFNPRAFIQILIRQSVPGSKIRPSIVHTKNRYKQPSNS